jgi:hypothetical protein
MIFELRAEFLVFQVRNIISVINLTHAKPGTWQAWR